MQCNMFSGSGWQAAGGGGQGEADEGAGHHQGGQDQARGLHQGRRHPKVLHSWNGYNVLYKSHTSCDQSIPDKNISKHESYIDAHSLMNRYLYFWRVQSAYCNTPVFYYLLICIHTRPSFTVVHIYCMYGIASESVRTVIHISISKRKDVNKQ